MNVSELKKLVNNIPDEATLTNWTLHVGPATTRQLYVEWILPPRKKGYCERTKQMVLEANPGYGSWEKSPYRVIDYPLEKTVAILFPKRPVGVIGVSPDRLRKYNAELRLFKPVRNGTIIAYHFND